jgi:hypothetical protein
MTELYIFMQMERAMTRQIRHLKFSYLFKLIRLPAGDIKFRGLFT